MEGGLTQSQAVSRFGVVCGMTLPMLSLPIVFLGAINLVLAPRLARACALGREGEVRRLVSRAAEAVCLLALPAMALMVVVGPDLGRVLFHQAGVGEYLVPLAAATAMGCLCSVLSAALNAVGEQRAVAAISLLGGAVQLAFTLALVPRPGVGMAGFVAGAAVSGGLELALCLWRTARRTGLRPPLFRWLAAPGLASLLAGLTSNLLFRVLKDAGLAPVPAGLAARPSSWSSTCPPSRPRGWRPGPPPGGGAARRGNGDGPERKKYGKGAHFFPSPLVKGEKIG